MVGRLLCAGWGLLSASSVQRDEPLFQLDREAPCRSLPSCLLFRWRRHRRPLVWQVSRRGGRLCLSPHPAAPAPVNKSSSLGVTGLFPPSPPVSISCSVSLTGAVASSVGPPEGWPHSRTPHRSSRSFSGLLNDHVEGP